MALKDLLKKFRAGLTPPPPPVQINFNKYNQTPRVQAARKSSLPAQVTSNRLNREVQTIPFLKTANKTVPRLDLGKYASNIKKPIPRIGATIGLNLASDLINSPRDAFVGGLQTGANIGTRSTPTQFLSGAAPIGQALLTGYVPGAGKSVAQSATKLGVKSLSKPGLKTTLKQGAKTGGLIGGAYGGLTSIQNNPNASSVRQQLLKATPSALGGAAVGALGGAALSSLPFTYGRAKGILKGSDDISRRVYTTANGKPGQFKQAGFIDPSEFIPGFLKGSGKKGPGTGKGLPPESPIGGNIEASSTGGSGGRTGGPKLPGSPGRSQGPLQPDPKSGGKSSSLLQFYNTKRYKVNSETRQMMDGIIEDVKPQIEKVVGKRLSNKEVINTARKTSDVLRKTVTREETEKKIAANLNLRQHIAKAAEEGKVTPELVEAMIRDKAAATDIARQLQARSIDATPAEKNLLNTVIDSLLHSTEDTEAVINASKNVDFNDPEQVTAFYRSFIAPRAEDWLTKLRYNSMLSSPTTHITNAFSNAQGSAVLAPIEKTVAGTFDWLSSAVSGKSRAKFAGEGPAYAKGYASSMAEAAQKFSDVITGRALVQNPDVFNIPLTQAKTVGRVMENILDVPMKLLEASDQFFTTLAKGGATKALEYRVAKGGKVGKIGEQAAEEAAQRLFRGDLHPTGQGKVLSAIDDVTNTLFSLRNSKNPATRIIANFTFPFVKTPMNILKQGIEYSPLGVLTMDAADKTTQLAKVAIGTSVATAAASLVSSDRLTWAEPTSEKEKELYRASGKIPYSIKIGDTWVSYSKLHPAVAFNLALVASVKQSLDNRKLNQSQADGILGGLAKWLHFYADQSYLKNVGEFLKATGGDVEGPARLLAGYPQQVIPFRALLGWVNRIMDPVQRKPDPDQGVIDKQFQYLLTQIPGLSGEVPARLGPDGKPIANDNRLLNAVSPLRTSTANQSEDRRYKAQYGGADKFVQILNDKYKGQVGPYYLKTIGPMTDDQYTKWETAVKNGGNPDQVWKMIYLQKVQDASKRKVAEIIKEPSLTPDQRRAAVQAARNQAALMIKELQAL